MNPVDQNNQTTQDSSHNEVQLPSETPMSLTVPETPEIKPVETTPTIQPEITIIPQSTEQNSVNQTPTTPPIETRATVESRVEASFPQPTTPTETSAPVEAPVEVSLPQPTSTSSNLTFDATPDYTLSSKLESGKAGSQTLVLIIAGILGVLVVFGGGYYFLIANKTQTTATVETPAATQAQTQSTNMETNKEMAPVADNKVLTLSEYQVAVSKIETKTINTIKNTPINPANNTLSLDQIRFASDDLFANYQELINMNIPENVKPLHSILVTNYKTLVDSYDVILKSIKETNKISIEAKNQFSANYNRSVASINDSLTKIKSLK